MNGMTNLIKLFSILQLTKEQPLTGYLTAGIKQHETCTLAEHHYTATLLGWLIVGKIKQAGGKINERTVIFMLMIHDLSELFGGDIAGPLNRKYPDLREYKDKIGERAIELLTSYLDESAATEWKTLWQQMIKADTDEAIVVKICDQMDHQFFLEHHNYKTKYNPNHTDYRPIFIEKHIHALTSRIKDEKTRATVNSFLKEFNTNFLNEGFQSASLLMD